MDKDIVRNFFHNKFGIKLSDADIVKVCAVAGNVDTEAEEERIQKQIEAVRGLIVNFNEVKTIYLNHRLDDSCKEEFGEMTESIRTLTETLKPYLGDDKLEV
jgi:hypothetical protein